MQENRRLMRTRSRPGHRSILSLTSKWTPPMRPLLRNTVELPGPALTPGPAAHNLELNLRLPQSVYISMVRFVPRISKGSRGLSVPLLTSGRQAIPRLLQGWAHDATACPRDLRARRTRGDCPRCCRRRRCRTDRQLFTLRIHDPRHRAVHTPPRVTTVRRSARPRRTGTGNTDRMRRGGGIAGCSGGRLAFSTPVRGTRADELGGQRTPPASRSGRPGKLASKRREALARRRLGADSGHDQSSGKVSDGPSCGVILLNSPRTGR